MIKSITELKAEHKELQEQIEQLNEERFSNLILPINEERFSNFILPNYYREKTKEMLLKIILMNICENQLYQLIGSEAPMIAPFMYFKYDINPKNIFI